MIQLDNIQRHYKQGSGTIQALRGLSLRIAPGEFVAIMGSSGSGKSTLLKALARVLLPKAGEVSLDGINIHSIASKEVAKKMMLKAKAHADTYKDREPTDFERHTFKEYAEFIDREIKDMIPESEHLSICLTGCAEEGISHYDIEHSLLEVFKPGEGVQYDSESGQFWMYVKPELVHPVLRAIDYNFPGQIELIVDTNHYATNPWFQNWTQAERYLKTVMGA